MDIRKQLGLNLHRLRREKGWSKEELAFESGAHELLFQLEDLKKSIASA